MTDEDLIIACNKGDPKAQKLLYERFAGKMKTVCLRYASGEDEANDMLQDGFIKVFSKLSLFEMSGSFEGWVRRTMVNTCLDHIRKKKKEGTQINVDEVYDLGSNLESALSKMAAEEIVATIQTLPMGYKTVFNLYAVEGYSHKEIAEELGITESTSKSQYFKAKQHLQRAYLELNENRYE